MKAMLSQPMAGKTQEDAELNMKQLKPTDLKLCMRNRRSLWILISHKLLSL